MRKIFISVFLILLIISEAIGYNQRFTLKKDPGELYLEINLLDGYKIYWIHAGECGYPTKIDLLNSKNIGNYSIKWPYPQIGKNQDNQKYYYYSGVVRIPLILNSIVQSDPIKLNIGLEYLLCGEQCFSVKQTITEEVNLKHIDKTFHNFHISGVNLAGNKLKFIAKFDHKVDFPSFLIDPKKHDFVKTTQVVQKTKQEYEVLMEIDEALEKGNNVTQYQIYSNQADFPAELIIGNNNNIFGEIQNLVTMTLPALIGGFILNFMPCVLPVLGLKAFAFIKNPNLNRRVACMSTITGIIVTFLGLAAVTIILKSSGNYFGFGTGFQNSQFIIFLCIVITIFISSALDRINISFNNVFGKKIHKNYLNNFYVEHFTSGVMAAILSTPCNAPFLGTAMAMAMASTNFTILYGFLTAGLGFSVPYFLIMIHPSLLSFLPKPGNWMIIFKKLLAGMLALTLIWLLSIVFGQLGFRAGLILVGLLFLLKFVVEA